MLRRQLPAALTMVAVLTVLLGVAYPLAVTGVASLAFPDQARGSFVERDGVRVGSRLIGQSFTEPDGTPRPEYFQTRPSVAGAGYDAMASGGSNLGPGNPVLLDTVAERVDAYRALNGLAADVAVPVDAVTASASGLDPHISVANARLQVARVAAARRLPEATVRELVDAATDEPLLGFVGERVVNVVELNLALDDLAP